LSTRGSLLFPQDLRHPEPAVLDRGRTGQRGLVSQARADDVLSSVKSKMGSDAPR